MTRRVSVSLASRANRASWWVALNAAILLGKANEVLGAALRKDDIQKRHSSYTFGGFFSEAGVLVRKLSQLIPLN